MFEDKTAYFDNAATTFPKPESVYTNMDRFYRQFGVNAGRGQYQLADRATKLIAETRELLLDMFHCPQKQVVFTPSATEAMNVTIQGLSWRDGINVYLSPFEHNAVSRTINYIGQRYKINVFELGVDKQSLKYDLERILYQFQENAPHLLVVSHASNVCGIIAPIDRIFSLAKKYGAITIVDMAQTAGLIDIDLNAVQADFAVFAGHKTLYGPFGIAGFISNRIKELNPLIYGGTGIDSANPNLPEDIPERFEVGSQNIVAIAGLNAAIKWIHDTGMENIWRKEQNNKKELLTLFERYPNIRVVTSTEDIEQIGVISCVFTGYSSDDIGRILNDRMIAVRTGLHCSPAAHRFLGTMPNGTVRFSVNYFNDVSDFQMLHEALDYIEQNS